MQAKKKLSDFQAKKNYRATNLEEFKKIPQQSSSSITDDNYNFVLEQDHEFRKEARMQA